jgi:hypothetical protein
MANETMNGTVKTLRRRRAAVENLERTVEWAKTTEHKNYAAAVNRVIKAMVRLINECEPSPAMDQMVEEVSVAINRMGKTLLSQIDEQRASGEKVNPRLLAAAERLRNTLALAGVVIEPGKEWVN